MKKKITLLLIIALIVFFSYNLVLQITSTLKSGDKLQIATEEIHLLEIENQNLRKKLFEAKSPFFLEKIARDKLGFAKEGETIVIIPDKKVNEILGASQSAQEVRLPNWLGWFRLFWH